MKDGKQEQKRMRLGWVVAVRNTERTRRKKDKGKKDKRVVKVSQSRPTDDKSEL